MNASKLNILLVEDEPNINRLVRKALEAEGFAVLSLPGKPYIDNYEDAITLAHENPPHICVIDIKINGTKDGIEIGAYMREHFYCPIIFLSGRTSTENVNRVTAMAADGFVAKMGKPLNMVQLKLQIGILRNKAIEAARLRSESGYFSVTDFPVDPRQKASFRNTRIVWKQLKRVEVAKTHTNSIVLTLDSGKQYLSHQSLTRCEKILPENFLRFSGTLSINSDYFISKGKSKWVRYTADGRYEVSKDFRTAELEQKMKRLRV